MANPHGSKNNNEKVVKIFLSNDKDMYVIKSGQKIQLRAGVAPTMGPTYGPTCPPRLSSSQIPAKKKEKDWTYWFKWFSIFVLFAALFYCLCIADQSSSSKKSVRFLKPMRNYKFYYPK